MERRIEAQPAESFFVRADYAFHAVPAVDLVHYLHAMPGLWLCRADMPGPKPDHLH